MERDADLVRVAVGGHSRAHLARPDSSFTLCGRIAGRWWRGRASSTCRTCVFEAGNLGLSIPRQGVL